MKTLVVRISAASILALTLFIANPLHGQASDFKAGDSVEIMVNGKWEAGSVTGRSGCGGTCGGYYVSQPGGSSYVNAGPANIRALANGPAQQPVGARPAAAPASRPTATVQAQTTDFKVGDSVEAIFNGKWEPGIVTGRSGCGGACGGYYVAQGTSSWFAKEGPANIRAHTMTPAQQSEANKSAAELAARAGSGNGIGAQYGVREPATCKSRTTPPATAATAKQYVLCGMEGFDGVQSVNLLTDVTVQVAGSRPFNYARDAADNQVDLKAPVFDIRGAFKQYQCTKPRTGGGTYLATHNCIFYDQPVATGSCYRDTFGDWHCSLTGNRLASTGIAGQMAPR
jgi:hypothetical protein